MACSAMGYTMNGGMCRIADPDFAPKGGPADTARAKL